jgi:quercetin dioxygenase-like cupin family protein
MHESDAFGVDVFYDDSGEKPFGLWWIKFPPFGEVKLHTHKGSHMLVCFAGNGKVCVEIEENGVKKIREELLLSWYCYSIPSMIPHSVHAGAETLLLLVIGNDYRPADSHDRLDLIK